MEPKSGNQTSENFLTKVVVAIGVLMQIASMLPESIIDIHPYVRLGLVLVATIGQVLATMGYGNGRVKIKTDFLALEHAKIKAITAAVENGKDPQPLLDAFSTSSSGVNGGPDAAAPFTITVTPAVGRTVTADPNA